MEGLSGMTNLGAMSDLEWERELYRRAFAAGADKAHSWSFEFEDGEDGCMPPGWYAIGLDAVGLPITWPVRHEYGPYKTEAEARQVEERANKR